MAALKGFPTPEVFVEVWEGSASLWVVSCRLLTLGYFKMTIRVVRRWARTFRETGVRLKRMDNSFSRLVG